MAQVHAAPARAERKSSSGRRTTDPSGVAQLVNSGPRALALGRLAETANAGSINRTGLPDHVKAGAERASGLSLDDVRVHYNSSRPAQLAALAYAQGSDIHVAPGQERHVAHEAWHIVQQAQGRVRPTMRSTGGTPINDDHALEAEADRMASVIAQTSTPPSTGSAPVQRRAIGTNTPVIQRRTEVNYRTQTVSYTDAGAVLRKEEVGGVADAWIDIEDPITGSAPAGQQKEMYDRLAKKHGIKYFIRGHLLNDHLGGLGEVYNLFPITAHANSQHKVTAEGFLKKYTRIEQAAKKAGKPGPYFVHYRVTAVPKNPADMSVNADAEFQCEMVSAHSDFVGGKADVWTIESQPGQKVEADGDHAASSDYSNKNLGAFGAQGTGEHLSTQISRLRSKVNGWEAGALGKFRSGSDISGHVTLSQYKDQRVAELEKMIEDASDADDAYGALTFELGPKAQKVFAGKHDAAEVDTSYGKLLDWAEKHACKDVRHEFAGKLTAKLVGEPLSDADKKQIFDDALLELAPFTSVKQLRAEIAILIPKIEARITTIKVALAQ